jgi:hypothetical protein
MCDGIKRCLRSAVHPPQESQCGLQGAHEPDELERTRRDDAAVVPPDRALRTAIRERPGHDRCHEGVYTHMHI